MEDSNIFCHKKHEEKSDESQTITLLLLGRITVFSLSPSVFQNSYSVPIISIYVKALVPCEIFNVWELYERTHLVAACTGPV